MNSPCSPYTVHRLPCRVSTFRGQPRRSCNRVGRALCAPIRSKAASRVYSTPPALSTVDGPYSLKRQAQNATKGELNPTTFCRFQPPPSEASLMASMPCTRAPHRSQQLPVRCYVQGASCFMVCTMWRCCARAWSAPWTFTAACWAWRWVLDGGRCRCHTSTASRHRHRYRHRCTQACESLLLKLALLTWPSRHFPPGCRRCLFAAGQPGSPARQAAVRGCLAVDWPRDDPPHGAAQP